MAQKKGTKIKVRDLKPKKDAKGGGRNYFGAHQQTSSHQSTDTTHQQTGTHINT